MQFYGVKLWQQVSLNNLVGSNYHAMQFYVVQDIKLSKLIRLYGVLLQGAWDFTVQYFIHT